MHGGLAVPDTVYLVPMHMLISLALFIFFPFMTAMMNDEKGGGNIRGCGGACRWLYESIAGFEEGEILGIAPGNSHPMHLVHHNDACGIYFPPVVQTHLYKSERKS